jgi:PTH1 family peptidyl-tRNA hydrolase
MYLIVGLGNPGSGYRRTNHNLGAEIVEIFGKNPKILFGEKFLDKKQLASNIFSLSFRNNQGKSSVIFYYCPNLMNISGPRISKIYKKYGCSGLIVLVDELDLGKNTFKITKGSGNGGHNGMRSIRSSFPAGFGLIRVKLGISRPESSLAVSEYVLEKTSNIDFYQLAKDVAAPLSQLILTSC